ncbi:PBSX family phage terminase [Fructilactobacillus fructivorans]|uniref:PBSX family phage terminase large subunit n=1 Tax=Fructilactobacillus fructivorans TaxID=1614 RepID=UPI00071601FD|nr:PBSX family phage terminase large subunit [Fructilactobacillus fructivorans]KRN13454.1 PBSX family phage terminase [Fructilactobacillus fructivorans]
MTKINLNNLFTPKQQEVIDQEINNPYWTLMINYGAVRAGKTFVDNFVFLFELRHAAEVAQSKGVAYPQYILAGVDTSSIQSNIILEMLNTFGLEFKKNRFNGFDVKFPNLPPVQVRQAYTGNIRGLGSIRGMTSYGAYINEASKANQEIFNEIHDRCSADGARIVCDTNPDIPTHWLKVNYIDKAKDSKFIIANKFTLDDNVANLSPQYVESLKETTPSGMFYDRAIKGLWVSGEGLVYQDYNEKDNTITAQQFNKVKQEHTLSYYCGLDWGFEHKGSIVLMADDEDGNTYLVKEWTYQHRQIEYWMEVAKEIQQQYGLAIPFYCDSARPEYVARFQDANIKAINAYKARMTGTEEIADIIHNNKFMAVKDNLMDFETEIYQYTWNEKAGEPIKKDGMDDCMDALRYAVATKNWYKREQELSKRDNGSITQQNELLQSKGLIGGQPRMGV